MANNEQLVQATEKETDVTIELSELPTELIIDPDYDLMRTLAPTANSISRLRHPELRTSSGG